VQFGAVLFDQGQFGVNASYNTTTKTYKMNASPAMVNAVNWGNDAVHNATIDVWPHVAIGQYKRGEMPRASGDCASLQA
jgi:hypothetical protein